MQANLLGFNTSCAKHAAACALIKTDLPQQNATPIAPEAFTQ
jgi:hypothetical protein